MRKVFVAAVVFVTVMAALVVASESARATYPGATNGRVAFGLSVNGNVDVYSMLPNGNDLRRLTDDPSFESCSAYSPDGKWIAYCSGQSGNFEIWKMKQNGKQRQQVTHTGGRMIFPDFSPDGTKIVFSGHLPGGRTRTSSSPTRTEAGRCTSSRPHPAMTPIRPGHRVGARSPSRATAPGSSRSG